MPRLDMVARGGLLTCELEAMVPDELTTVCRISLLCTADGDGRVSTELETA